MRPFPALLLALALCPFARAAVEAKGTDLYNGKDLTGWSYVTPGKEDIATVCHVKPDGVLAVDGKPTGYLQVAGDFENYRLHVEWRWPATAAKNSNSGVLFHIASGPVNNTAWPVCFQMQLKLTRAGDLLPMADAKFAEKLTTAPGARTPQLDRQQPASEKPLGEWNSCDISCLNGTIEVTVNGVAQNKVTHAAPASGKIGFQLEGTPYELRNVRIYTLK